MGRVSTILRMTEESASAAAEPVAAENEQPTTENDYLRMAQRAQADLINYRRRVDQERDEMRLLARIDATSAILPVLDDFERALTAIPAEERDKAWVQGILLIERNLRGVLERAGIERIDAQGLPFDPREHEAVMTEPSAEHEEDYVTRVLRSGYRAGGRVVRPAQVVVSRGKAS